MVNFKVCSYESCKNIARFYCKCTDPSVELCDIHHSQHREEGFGVNHISENYFIKINSSTQQKMLNLKNKIHQLRQKVKSEIIEATSKVINNIHKVSYSHIKEVDDISEDVLRNIEYYLGIFYIFKESRESELVELVQKTDFELKELEKYFKFNKIFDYTKKLKEKVGYCLKEYIKGEMILSSVSKKTPMINRIVATFRPWILDTGILEETEIICCTEENTSSEEEELEIPAKPIQINSFSNVSTNLGIIKSEEELELEKAIANLKDPEVLIIPHKQTGKLLKIKKEFNGAIVVDSENKIVPGKLPIDSVNFNIPLTIVDKSDVRFAILTAYSGEIVRVKRNFKYARILEELKSMSITNSHLIGQSVKQQEDFHYELAFPRPKASEKVADTHKLTGKDVKVKKSLNETTEIKKYGQFMQRKPPIKRREYDFSDVITKKEDVYIGMLEDKETNKRVKEEPDFNEFDEEIIFEPMLLDEVESYFRNKEGRRGRKRNNYRRSRGFRRPEGSWRGNMNSTENNKGELIQKPISDSFDPIIG